MSITAGAMATTRGSTAAVSQVVQPRFDPPETTNLRSSGNPCSRTASWVASMARTADLVIGNCAAHCGSPVWSDSRHDRATRSSSLRARPSPRNTSGWLGVWPNSATTDSVASATARARCEGPRGAAAPLLPPPMNNSPVSVAAVLGIVMASQCCHNGRSISASVRQVWEPRSSTRAVASSSSRRLTRRHAYDASGAATYWSNGVISVPAVGIRSACAGAAVQVSTRASVA